MKTFWKAVDAGLVLSAALLLAGCMSSTFADKSAKATAKVEAAKQKETALEDRKVDTAKAYVYGAGEALRQPEGVPVASGLVRRAALTLGPPSMEDAGSMDKIVSGMLSAEQEARKAAEARLAVLDARVVGLERRLEQAQKATEKAEEKRDGVLAEASGFADKYLSVRRLVYAAIGLFAAYTLLPVLLRILALFSGGPIGGLVASTLGSLIRSVGQAVPETLSKAGVVALEQHRRVEAALENVVVGVERFKKSEPGAKAPLGAILRDETNRESDRLVIENILVRNKDRIR